MLLFFSDTKNLAILFVVAHFLADAVPFCYILSGLDFIISARSLSIWSMLRNYHRCSTVGW